MSDDKRIFKYISVDIDTIKALFYQYDTSIKVESAKPISAGMSTSNFEINTDTNKYLLKVYPENNDHSLTEIAMYQYAKKCINVPAVLFLDNSKRIFHSTYAINEYIESESLGTFLKAQSEFSEKVFYKIGEMLALIHKKTYPDTGILNEDLSLIQTITPINMRYEKLLSEKAGEYIGTSCKSRLLDFVNQYPKVIEKITENNVLSHGDFNFNNILVDRNDVPWFIDFEYAFSTSIYYDIGKLFRTKEQIVQVYVTDKLRKWFYDGYNSQSENKLPADWCVLSKLADIVAMLAFINNDTTPPKWVEEIEQEIASTLDFADEYYGEKSI